MEKYKDLSKEELLRLIEKQEKELKNKKYGLVWDSEREPEQVVLDCKNHLPILERVRGKEIKTDDSEDNILIEGDNYHALTVLNYTHKGKIDVIYIDPPYNTGKANEWKYNDKYVDKNDSYRHSKWLNFMEKRLKLAKELLKDDGVIFISIGDNELCQLKLLMDEIFGEENFISNIIWHKKTQPSFLTKEIINVTEYILVYKKDSNKNLIFKGGYTDPNKHIEMLNISNQITTRIFKKSSVIIGKNFTGVLKKGYYGNGDLKVELLEEINVENGVSDKDIKIKGRFKWSQEKINQAIKEGGIIYFKSTKTLRATLKLPNNITKIKAPISILSKYINDIPTNTGATNELKNMFNGISPMKYSKPMKLIKFLIESKTFNNKNAIIFDFFAGSGTTGHAVLELNKEDGGNRRFILVTNNEENIATEICYPRLEKVIKGYNKNRNNKWVEGLGGNLQYFKTSFIKKSKNINQLRTDFIQKITETFCLKENIYNLAKEGEDYKIFSSNKKDRFLCIYYNLIDNNFNEFLKEIKKLKGKKIIYMFAIDNKVDKSLFLELDDFTIEPIPQKILDVYNQLVKIIKEKKYDNNF